MRSRVIPLGLVRVWGPTLGLALGVPLGGCEIVFDFEDRPLRECTPDALSCDGGQRVRCDGDGLGLSPAACPAEAPLCVGEGSCVGCVDDAGCATASPCEVGRCEAGACGVEVQVGQPCGDGLWCTALGACATCIGDADCGVADDCSTPRCEQGECRIEIDLGGACEEDGLCDEAGACVECLQDSDCGEAPTCHVLTCESGECVEGFAPRGSDCGDLDCTGTGECGECNPDTRACAVHEAVTCSARGLQSVSSCPAGCSDGECLSAVSLAQGTPLDHMCAVWSDGSLVCWGLNDKGQLGPTGELDVVPPGRVPGLDRIVQVSVGWAHTCAVDDRGALFCFGANEKGQARGDGSVSTTSPVFEVPLPGPVRGVAAGRARTCAYLVDGRTYCWGENDSGQLGVGDQVDSAVPLEVEGLSDVVEMALGADMTCARTGGGDVFCWGRDNYVGNGGPSAPNAVVPEPVPTGIDDALVLRSGDLTTCAVRASGPPVCWGGNAERELGDGTTTDRLSPTPIVGLAAEAGTFLVDNAFRHGCAAVAQGVACWGRNENGSLGRDCGNPCLPPEDAAGLVQDLGPVEDLAAAWGHTCVIEQGVVRCWGYNAHGQLGDATTGSSDVPVTVLPPER